VNVDVLPGASQQVTFRFSLPQAHGVLTLVPSARIPAASWNVDGTTFTDATARTINW
jgi:hypothetical protein